MDKNAIKKYAVWARRELIERVSQRALRFGITADGNADPKADSVDGYLLSAVEKKQRAALIKKVEEHGYEQVLEEAAYTWFNRFAALRFMEVNGYLPSHVRVFTNDAGEFKPQILAEAIHLELDGLNMDKVYELKDANNTEELYRYLLIVQCNALSSILPGMFQRIADYTELLLPENLLREGSVLQQMIELIPEEDWQEQVQIIGWLYQYYNTEPKDKVFADLKKNIKVTKEKIPAATQLFTPDWIVRYMVENSLGRLWLEGHPNDTLKSTWKYYLDEADQEPEVAAKLAEIRKTYVNMKPEEIKVIDPCMGSGHILCYLFDVLVQIYEDYGHTAREAVEGILTNNLYGLDIDDRAAQLAYFAVMMKARQYDRRFFSRGIQPHVMAIQESNGLTKWSDMTFGMSGEQLNLDSMYVQMADYLIEKFQDAKEYGSILNVDSKDYHALLEFVQNLHENSTLDLSMAAWLGEVTDRLPVLVKQAGIISQKYDVVVTNPPYMGGGNMSVGLSKFVKKEYPDSKNDLFAIFIDKCLKMTRENGNISMVTMHSWMFLSSYETLRKRILSEASITSISHLGMEAFDGIIGKVVATVSFSMQKNTVTRRCVAVRLTDYYDARRYEKEKAFFYDENRIIFEQDKFDKIPGKPIAYWVSEDVFSLFDNDNIAPLAISPSQNITGNNERFVREHWEIEKGKIGQKDLWIFWAKGGKYRKWWGNLHEVVDWSPEARQIYQYGDGKHASQIINKNYWYKKGITWGQLTSGDPSFRIMPEGATFDKSGTTIIVEEDIYNYVLGLLNSKVYSVIAKVFNSTFHFQVKDVKQMPFIRRSEDEVSDIVNDSIKLSKLDWDSLETSWEFKIHPLVSYGQGNVMYRAFEKYKVEINGRFDKLKENEEKLNRIFIDTYGLSKELNPNVSDKDVTVARIYDAKEKIPESMKGNIYVLIKEDVVKSFISYAVGCMFGRYSLDVEGLAYAGGEWDASKYKTFLPDRDAIIPICDDEYFEDDIVGRFVQFVEVVYGKETLEENLQFIADALGGRGTSREVIRNYFVSSFYADHVKTYKKRPIYWLFDSGKKNGFKCLIYMHRYQPDTLARIRTDYIHEQQSRYRTVIESLEQQIASAGSSSEKVKLTKLLNTRQAQAKEIREYEEKVHHLADQMIKIDLDDGVKHNYAIFKDVLAKIK